MTGKNVSGIFLPLLVLGCRLPPPTPEDLAFVRQLPPPPGPYARVTAVADLESERLAGTFDVLVLARTGPSPLVRLQLLPDLGGKAVDLEASPDRLRGRLPHSGEEIDWELPGDAKAHPLLFIAITLLERFAPLREDRPRSAAAISGHVQGDGPIRTMIRLTPIVPGAKARLDRGQRAWELVLGWGPVEWTVREHEVIAKGFHLKLRDVKVEALATLDEGLLRLK
jgi:hypothetical protein